MTTSQVALKGLLRCLDFTEMQRDSQSSFYSSSVESLIKIRDLANKIYIAANDALAKVNLDEPVDIVKNSNEHHLDSIESYIDEAVDAAVSRMINQFNIVNQQSISIDISTGDNSHKLGIKESPKDVIDVKAIKSHDGESSETFISDFKSVLHKPSEHSIDAFKYEQSKIFADLAYDYFNVRFSKKYDVKQQHRFSQTKLRDYLASILLSYCDSIINNGEDGFLSHFNSWLTKLKESGCKYTLPSNSASIFFQILNKSDCDISTYLNPAAIDLANQIWDDLWIHGYFMFDSLDSSYCPTSSLSWIQSKLGIASEILQVSNEELECVYNLWVDLTQRENYDLLRAVAIKSSPLLQTLDYHDNVKLPETELYEALKVFMKSEKFSDVDDIKMKIRSISALIDVIDTKCADIADAYEYIKDFPADKLDLVEVLESYASYNLE